MTQLSLKNEFFRKLIHFSLVLVPIAYIYLEKWLSVAIFSGIAAIIITLDYYRRSNPKIKNIFAKIFGLLLRERELEGNQLCSASWVMLAACLNFLFFSPEIAVTSFLILVISDGLAAIIGKSFPSEPFFEKTKNGAAAFFISALIVLISCGVAYHCSFWFYFFGSFAVTVVTLIESRPSLVKIDDNFLIPIVFSLTMTIFDFMWNYSY